MKNKVLIFAGIAVAIVASLTLSLCSCVKTVIVPCPQYILIMQAQNQAQGQSTINFIGNGTNQSYDIQLEGITNVRYFIGTNGQVTEVSNLPPDALINFATNFWK